jgi:hypothetical protein
MGHTIAIQSTNHTMFQAFDYWRIRGYEIDAGDADIMADYKAFLRLLPTGADAFPLDADEEEGPVYATQQHIREAQVLLHNPAATIHMLFKLTEFRGIDDIPVPEHYGLAWSRFLHSLEMIHAVCSSSETPGLDVEMKCTEVFEYLDILLSRVQQHVSPADKPRFLYDGWVHMVYGVCLHKVSSFRVSLFDRVRDPILESIAGIAGDKDLMPYLADVFQALDRRFDFGQVTTTASDNRLENALAEASRRCDPHENLHGLTVAHLLFGDVFPAAPTTIRRWRAPLQALVMVTAWNQPDLLLDVIKYSNSPAHTMLHVLERRGFLDALGESWLRKSVSAYLSPPFAEERFEAAGYAVATLLHLWQVRGMPSADGFKFELVRLLASPHVSRAAVLDKDTLYVTQLDVARKLGVRPFPLAAIEAYVVNWRAAVQHELEVLRAARKYGMGKHQKAKAERKSSKATKVWRTKGHPWEQHSEKSHILRAARAQAARKK